MIHTNSGRHHQCPKHTRSVAFCVCVKESLGLQRVCYTLWQRAMVLSSTLTLTALPQIKNPFNYKTAQRPAQCSFCLQEFQAPARCFQLSHTFFLSKHLHCAVRAALQWSLTPAQSEAAQLSSTLRTANLIVLHTLMIKAENEIPCCLTALRTITGFCTWK